ncbi:MAG: BON domain-containing protein [Pseudomonadota bacterium]
MKAKLLVAVGAGAMSLSGCVVAAVGAAGMAGVTIAQERSVGQAIDDASTSTQIKTLLLDEGERFSEVDVEMSGGLALLSGRVDAVEDRARAEQLAWGVKRVEDVANEIQIGPAGGFGSQVSDEFITARVRAALFGSRQIRSYNFNIETYDGVVYLMGVARSPEELQRAAEKASYVSGVEKVVSYVVLRDGAVFAPEPEPEPLPEPEFAPEPAPILEVPYQEAPNDAYTAEPDAPSDELFGGSGS